MATSIYGMIYDELDAKRKHAPEEFRHYKKAFDLLDREAIAGLMLEGSTFWIEWPSIYDNADDAGVEELANYLYKKGYEDLYK